MKQLKSSIQDLRDLFEQSLVVRDLAEPLASFDETQAATVVQEFMREKNFDIIGVRRHGLVVGYGKCEELDEGMLSGHLIQFSERDQMHERDPIVDVLHRLDDSLRVFVGDKKHIWGIVTRGDLQKAPFRMCLFGLISLLEMQFLRLIRASYPDDTWKSYVSKARISTAQEILSDRHRRNEATDLADCLQLSDKASIIAKSREIRSHLGFDSISAFKKLLKRIEDLRNDLAHGQDIITGRWPGIVGLVGSLEDLGAKCEKYGTSTDVMT